MITTIGFDADDTLWQNEAFFRLSQERFVTLLADYADPDHLMERLTEAEMRNLGHYGFGIKGFVLSMIETALDVTENSVAGSVVRELIDAGQDMLQHPIHLLEGAADAVKALAATHTLILITKGDLLDQERKLAQSGLGEYFDGVDIVSDKTPQTYQNAFSRPGMPPSQSVMVGNSLRSDILPALKAGAHAVHVPHDLTWSYERADTPGNSERFHQITSLADLPELIATL